MKLKCISVKKAILSSLLALFTVTIVGFSNSYQVKAEEAEQYALGCIPDDASVLESLQIAKNSPKAANDSLPRSVDLESKMPSPGNQGQQGSCTAWAVAYAANHIRKIKNILGLPMGGVQKPNLVLHIYIIKLTAVWIKVQIF